MAGDPYYNNVALLLHCDGANGSTTITDTSPSPKTVTANGNAQITTSDSDFDGGAVLLDGTGDWLQIPNHADFNPGGNDFTFELRFKLTAYAPNNGGEYYACLVSKDVAGSRQYSVSIRGNSSSYTTLQFEGFSNNTTPVIISVSTTFLLDTLYSISVSRVGDLIYIAKNGVILNPGGTTFAITIQGTTTPLLIGANNFDATYLGQAHIKFDEVRWTPGIGRYTTDYTPVFPFPDSPRTIGVDKPLDGVGLSGVSTLGVNTSLLKQLDNASHIVDTGSLIAASTLAVLDSIGHTGITLTYTASQLDSTLDGLGYTIGDMELFTLTIPTSISVFETYSLSIPTSISVFEQFTLSIPISVNVYEAVQLSIPTSISVYETFTLSLPVSIAVFEPVTLSLPVSITVTSVAEALAIPVFINVYETLTLTIPVSIQVVPESFRLTIPLSIGVYETLQLSLPVAVQVYPTFASGTGGQGVGQVVTVPVNNSQRWSPKIFLNGADVTSRVTGEINIDIERSAAVVATFSLKPAAGLVDPYSWVKAPVQIYYVARDAEGVQVFEYLLFKGLADTPIYDTASRLVEFTCTDDLQNVVKRMSRASIDALTPASKWSKFVFDELADSWDYLQNRLETHPYAVGLDTNGFLQVREFTTSTILYEFTANMIVDGSLSPSLANARDITNYYDVSLDVQYDQFRESVINMRWEDQDFLNGEFPNWWMCSAQMLIDAVQGTGSTFVNDPLFQIQPASHWAQNGGLQWAQVNYGIDLTLTSFIGAFSKRFTQSIIEHQSLVIQDINSVAQLGILRGEMSASISAEYSSGVADEFLATTQKQRWLSSAGAGFQTPRLTDAAVGDDPLLFISDGTDGGWVPYPRYDITYNGYASDDVDSVLYGLHTHMFTIDSNGVPISGAPGFGTSGGVVPGEYFYDLDSFLVNGSLAEQVAAKDCVIAQAQTSILESHRQNRVNFSTPINPFLQIGQTVRVNHPTMLATGVVRQITHTFSIDAGTALTNVSLAVSASKALGIPDGVYNNIILRIPISVTVFDGTTQSQLPIDANSMDHELQLFTDYTGNGLASYVFDGNNWGGYFTKTTVEGNQEFALEFPQVSATNSTNAEITIQDGMINVNVPNDEFYLFA